MLNLSFKRFQKTGVLTLSGELLSSYIDDFKSALMMALDNSEQLIINFKKVSKLDKAYIQMLCAAVNISASLKKHLIFNADTLKHTIRENCIDCTLGCSFFSNSTCFLLPV
jgi:anti-anti-sigma regulatory factor